MDDTDHIIQILEKANSGGEIDTVIRTLKGADSPNAVPEASCHISNLYNRSGPIAGDYPIINPGNAGVTADERKWYGHGFLWECYDQKGPVGLVGTGRPIGPQAKRMSESLNITQPHSRRDFQSTEVGSVEPGLAD